MLKLKVGDWLFNRFSIGFEREPAMLIFLVTIIEQTEEMKENGIKIGLEFQSIFNRFYRCSSSKTEVCCSSIEETFKKLDEQMLEHFNREKKR